MEIGVLSVGCKFIKKLSKNENNFRNTDDDGGNCFIHIILRIPLESYTLLKSLGSIIYAIDISRYYNNVKILGIHLYVNPLGSSNMWITMKQEISF